MDEKRRFAVALAGVAGCLCLAAGIALSGHGDAVAPRVDPPLVARVEALPRWPMPSLDDVARPQPKRRAQLSAPRDLAMTALMELPASTGTAVESTPVGLAPRPEQRPPHALATRHLAILMLVGTAPDATGAEVLVAQERTRRRGALTGAVVTAGTHVGGSFKTVGRTLRRVF